MKRKGSTFGASLLIAGCAIGAGMLGMPVVTREGGFFPAVLLFLLGWLFMTLSGLILLEVALWFPQETHMAEMAKKYLGKSGEWIVFALMLFLMYSLMTAYAAGAGQLLYDMSEGAVLPYVGTLLFGLLVLLALILGTFALDWMNRLFMVGLILAYLALVAFGLPHIELKNLFLANWGASFVALPIIIVSFGYQNLVPSLLSYLDGDAQRVRKSILIGTTIPLVVYLIWEFVILGLISDKVEGLNEAQMATSLIRMAAGGLSLVISMAEAFAFFAITTSFMGNALSLLDFFLDQAKGRVAKGERRFFKRGLFALLSVVPPLVFAYLEPNIFLVALNIAGSFSAVLLFGLIPALMCLKGVSEEKREIGNFLGSKFVLFVMIGFSLGLLIFS